MLRMAHWWRIAPVTPTAIHAMAVLPISNLSKKEQIFRIEWTVCACVRACVRAFFCWKKNETNLYVSKEGNIL